LEHLEDKAFLENFVRMEKWIFDSPDVPGETFRQFIKDCYQKNLLIRNKMVVGRRVDLNNITMPVLNFYGRFDHLVPPEACERIVDAVPSNDAPHMSAWTRVTSASMSAANARKRLLPEIVQWLQERETPPKAKEKIKKRRTAANSKQARKEILVPDQMGGAKSISPESPQQHAPNP
jgi:polyhydroxyalkanoate synthase subunit PhaC